MTNDALIDEFCADTAALAKSLLDFAQKWEKHCGTLDEKNLTPEQVERITNATKALNDSLESM